MDDPSLPSRTMIKCSVRTILASDPISKLCYCRINPWVFATLTFLAGLFVFLLSYKVGVAHLSYTHSTSGELNVGYVDRLNWGYLYITIIPVLLGICSYTNRVMAHTIVDLHIITVITATNETADVGSSPNADLSRFTNDFSGFIARSRWWIVAIPVIAVIGYDFLDTHNVWGVFFQSDIYQIAADPPDWSTAFGKWNESAIAAAQANERSLARPSLGVNLLFDLAAYSLQSMIILFGIHFICRFVATVRTVAGIDRISKGEWKARAVEDAAANLESAASIRSYSYHLSRGRVVIGINPFGKIYDLFLFLYLAFGLYLCAHRWQELPRADKELWIAFASHVLKLRWISAFDGWESRMAFAGVDLMLIILGALYLAFGIVIVYYPMTKWTEFLDRLGKSLVREKYELLESQDKDAPAKLKTVERQLDTLIKTSRWPNGSLMAFVFIGLILSAGLLTIAPLCLPLAIPMALLGIYWSHWKTRIGAN